MRKGSQNISRQVRDRLETARTYLFVRRSFLAVPHRFLPDYARRVAIVGLAKNVGKTTALNALLAGLTKRNQRVGLMSVGVDGETFDALGGHTKPPVSVSGETVVCTSETALRQIEASYDVLASTKIRSTLGEVLICRMHRAGDVVLSGVRHRADVRNLTKALAAHDVDRVIIDGAFDRMAAASPQSADAVIAATGMAIGENIENVAQVSARWVQRFQSKQWDGPPPPASLAALRDGAWAPQEAALVTGPLSGDRCDALFAPGLISDSALRNAAQSLVTGGTLVCSDATALMAGDRAMRIFLRDRRIQVRDSIHIAAITVNPTHVDGRVVSSQELVDAVAAAVPGLPVLDVQTGFEVLPC